MKDFQRLAPCPVVNTVIGATWECALPNRLSIRWTPVRSMIRAFGSKRNLPSTVSVLLYTRSPPPPPLSLSLPPSSPISLSHTHAHKLYNPPHLFSLNQPPVSFTSPNLFYFYFVGFYFLFESYNLSFSITTLYSFRSINLSLHIPAVTRLPRDSMCSARFAAPVGACAHSHRPLE